MLPTSTLAPPSPPPFLTRNGSHTSTSASSSFTTPGAFETISTRTPGPQIPSSAIFKPSSFLDLPEEHLTEAEFDFETFNAFSLGGGNGEDVTGLGLGIWEESEGQGIGLVMGDEGEEKRRRREASSVSLSAAAASSTALQNLSGTNSRTSSSNLPSSSLFLQPQDSTIATSVARSLVHHTLRNPSSPSPIHPQLNPAYPVAAQPPHPPTGTYGDYGLEGVDEAQLSPFAIGLKRRREREIFVLRWDAGTGWTG